MTQFRAGYAETIITPPLGTPMAGLFHHREARTVVDDLKAKAIVLTDGITTLVMVVCDIISIPEILGDATRTLITERHGLPASWVMISATHTHTGPLLDLGSNDPGWRLYQNGGKPYRNARPAVNGMLTAKLDAGYRDSISVRIADAVTVALDRLQPATLAIGSTSIDGVCFNRRFHMKDGTVVFNPGFQNPEIVCEAGPVDPEIVSFLVETVDRDPIALWSTLSLHYVGTDTDDGISADYYGHFAEEIQRVLGCPALLANGTSGNINNVDVRRASELKGAEKARMVAKAVAAAAVSSVLAAPRTSEVRIGAWSASVEIERYLLTESDVEIAERVAAGEGANTRSEAERFSFEVGQRLPAAIDFSWSCDLLRLNQLPDVSTAEVQLFAIGDLAIAALPGEVFVEFGLDLKARSPFGKSAAISISNSHLGYLPNKKAFAVGGYETWRSRSNWTAPGSGERLVEAAVTGLKALSNGESL